LYLQEQIKGIIISSWLLMISRGHVKFDSETHYNINNLLQQVTACLCAPPYLGDLRDLALCAPPYPGVGAHGLRCRACAPYPKQGGSGVSSLAPFSQRRAASQTFQGSCGGPSKEAAASNLSFSHSLSGSFHSICSPTGTVVGADLVRDILLCNRSGQP
jgi:hypothetical protein